MVNHVVARKVMQGIMKDSAAKFFELPLEARKNRIAMPLDDMQGYGHASVVSDRRPSTYWNDLTDVFLPITHPCKYRNPKVWPPTPFN